MNRKYLSKYLVFLLLTLFACHQFVEIDPPKTQIITETVYSTEATAESAIVGIYSQMMNAGDFAEGGPNGIAILTGLSSDELTSYSGGDATNFNNNSLLSSTSTVKTDLWSRAYQIIYYSNAALEGLEASTNIRDSVKSQLQGEARFIRAFCYFYLTTLFGDVPLITVTDYQQNLLKSRSPQTDVYDLIKQDLIQAESLLPSIYPAGERIRPNKAVATAFLARVYLYTSDWQNAIVKSTSIISNSAYSLDELSNVFLKDSPEAIWQLQPVTPLGATFDGNIFILESAPSNVSLTNSMAESFEKADNRRTIWMDSVIADDNVYYFPFKYKIRYGDENLEYYVVLRLAEQYLIRAEARTQSSDFDGALADLNIIRNRAGLAASTAADKPALLLAIEQERKVELFTEWGHRWLDLKRTNRADAILGPLKGSTWQSTDVLYPIPITEINNDPNLSQNPGY